MLLVGGGLQLATDGRELNLLSFPLLGILAWNIAMYVALVVLAFNTPKNHPIISALVAKLMNRSSSEVDPLYLDQTLPIWTTRGRAWLHLGAGLLAVGAVASLYVRGLGTAYSAGWESTFLDAPQVHAILSTILGPASAVTGIPLPGPNVIESMRFGGGQLESARNWIHLFAATLGIFVVAPRIALALRETAKARRQARKITLPNEVDVFYRTLLKPLPPVGERLHAITFGSGADTNSDALDRLLEIASCPTRVATFHRLNYGFTATDLPEKLTNGRDSGAGWIAVFPMTTTPEAEVHGRLMEALRENTTEGRTLLLLDTTAFAHRFSNLANFDEKFDGRRKLWKKLADEHGLPMLEIHFEKPTESGWQEPLRVFVNRVQDQHD